MKFKIFGAVLAVAFAAGMIVAPASAHSPEKGGPITSIIPSIAGPVGAAALFSTTTTLNWTTTLYQKYFYDWSLKNILKAVQQGVELHKQGYEVHVDIKRQGIKINAEKDVKHSKQSKNTNGKLVVSCVMGSAFGAISASVRKATAMGNPLRWRSQAEHEAIVKSGYEKQFELTNSEATTSTAFCGLGSLALHWPQKAPAAVVKAKN
jgi:hypothetical protein